MSKVLHTILYVEDEPDIRHVVRLALEAVAGMHVIACSSGVEAIARANDVAVDLILLDVMMPQMDGPATLHRLREMPAFAQTPVVFMTAKAHPDEIAHFKTLGALDVIAKPFDPMTLAATLRAIWARATTAQESNAFSGVAGTAAEQRFAERMAEIAAQFRRELPSRLAALRRQWQAWNDAASFDALNVLHGTVHYLAGTGSTFGYDELTSHARALDRHLKALLEQQQLPDSALRAEIGALFKTLESELQRILLPLNR